MFENLPIIDDEDAEFLKKKVLPDLLDEVGKDRFREDLENRLLADLTKTNVNLAASVYAGAEMVVASLKADMFEELPDDVYWEMGWTVAVAELAVLGLIDRALGRQRANRR